MCAKVDGEARLRYAWSTTEYLNRCQFLRRLRLVNRDKGTLS